MKRLWLAIALLLILAMPGTAATPTAVTDMTEVTTPAASDLLYVVVDPTGTPLSRKATINNVVNAVLATTTIAVSRWYDVAGCEGSTAGHIFDTPSSNFPTPACDTGSNTQKAVLSFDASTDQSFYFKFRLQAGYSVSGGINVVFRWKATATSGAAGWCLQLVRVPVGSTSDPAFPSQSSSNCVSDTAQGTTLQENEAAITGVTCTSCVAGDLIYARLSRDADGSAVTDSLSTAALLIGFEPTYRKTIQ